MRPGNRYARERGLSRTLGQLVECKMALGAICGQSKHQRVLYLFGAGCLAIELGEHPCCSSCRGHMATGTNRRGDL